MRPALTSRGAGAIILGETNVAQLLYFVEPVGMQVVARPWREQVSAATIRDWNRCERQFPAISGQPQGDGPTIRGALLATRMPRL